jgi:hypothetical protein
LSNKKFLRCKPSLVDGADVEAEVLNDNLQNPLCRCDIAVCIWVLGQVVNIAFAVSAEVAQV